MKLLCPHCKTETIEDEEPNYYGEMRKCPRCSFRAYFDQWDVEGNYAPSTEPF